MYRMIATACAALALAGCTTMGQQIRDKGAALNGAALAVPAGFDTRITFDNRDQHLVRRELILALLAQSDRTCENYLIGMAAFRNETSLSLDLTSLVLGSVGALVDSAEAANILSGGSAAMQAAERTAEENLFGGRTQALIYTAVRQGRLRQRQQIMKDWEAKKFDGWSAASITAELDRYHLDCGVSFGLTELEAALARSAQEQPNGNAGPN